MRATLERVRRNGDDGFTLIELLIVIVILGVLAAIVVFSVNGITNKGDKAACQTTVSEIDTAFEANAAQGGSSNSTTVTLGDLTSYFHGGQVPTKAGANTLTSTTVVSTVDASGFCS